MVTVLEKYGYENQDTRASRDVQFSQQLFVRNPGGAVPLCSRAWGQVTRQRAHTNPLLWGRPQRREWNDKSEHRTRTDITSSGNMQHEDK